MTDQSKEAAAQEYIDRLDKHTTFEELVNNPTNEYYLKKCFIAGTDWREQHPSREMVEKIIRLARETVQDIYGEGWRNLIDDIMAELNVSDHLLR